MTGGVYFIHEGFKAHKAKYLMDQKGLIRRLTKGIYVDVDITDKEIRQSALYIAAYRYSNLRLMGKTAVRVDSKLTPQVNGVIYAVSESIKNSRVKGLVDNISIKLREPTQSPFETLSETLPLRVSDTLTLWIHLPCYSQLIWDSAYFPECSISLSDFNFIKDKIPENHMRMLLMDDRCSALLSEWESHSEKETLAAQKRILVYLQDMKWGDLEFSGVRWDFREVSDRALILDRREWDFYMESLFPEGWQKASDPLLSPRSVENPDLDRFLSVPRRLMNVTCFPEDGENRGIVVNTLDSSISSVVDEYRIVQSGVDQSIYDLISMRKMLVGDSYIPRMSGVQPKVACFIDDSVIRPSGGSDNFSLIVKPDPAVHDFIGAPVLEWAGQMCASLAGLRTPEYALSIKSDGSASAFISERFDIPKKGDNDVIFTLDGAIISRVNPKISDDKYNVSAQELWKFMLKRGLDPEYKVDFFKRLAFAWAIGDGDLHVKNFSLVFSGVRDRNGLVRSWTPSLSPAYDTLCTRAIECLAHDHMALHLSNDDMLGSKVVTHAHLGRFAKYLGIDNAQDIIEDISESVCHTMDGILGSNILSRLDGGYRSRCEKLLNNAHRIAHERNELVQSTSFSMEM